MSTYGELQDAAAASLTRLLTSSEIPVEEEELRTIEACRGILRDTLADRLALLGATPRQRQVSRQGTPLVQLAELVAQLPKRDGFADEALSPVDALHPYSASSISEWTTWWQDATGSALQATEALAGDPELSSWISRDATLWRLTTDAANTLEAIAILDQDMVSAGAVPGRVADLDQLDALRQGTSYIARMGDWYGTDASVDLATRGRGDPANGWRVQLVRSVADLEPAQRQLGDYFPLSQRPRAPRLTRLEALAGVNTQLRLATHLEQASRLTLGPTEETTQSFAQLRQSLGELREHLPRVHDVAPAPSRINVMGQLTELNNGLSRLRGRGELMDLSPTQLTALAQTSRWACGRFAQELSREASTRHGNLRFAQHGRVTRLQPGQPIEQTLTKLVDQAPGLPARAAWFPDPAGPRGQLRDTLDHTPTSRPPTRPSPSRGSDYGR